MAFLALVALVLTCSFVAPASAQIAFEKPPTELDFDTVAGDAGQAPVVVRNDGKSAAVVEVRVVGLPASVSKDNPNVGSVSSAGAISKKIEPGKSETVVLSLRTAARPKAGSYPATLVASGAARGETASIPLTLTVAKKATTTPEAGSTSPPRILPARSSDFSVSGTNFVPSFISPLPAALLGAGLLGLIVLWPFSGAWPFRGLRPPRLRSWHVGSAVLVLLLLAVIGAAWSMTDDDAYYEGPSPSVMAVNSPTVAPDSDPGPVGTLIGKDGSPVMAVVENNEGDYELRVEGVPRAGAYAGKVDLLAGVDGGEATMTANVHDFWLYPLLVIALGVLLGYAVSHYFARRREQRRQDLEVEELWTDIALQESQLAQDAPKVWRTYAIRERVGRRMTKIRALLASGEPTDIESAKAKLTELREYFETTQGMWRQLSLLQPSAASVRTLINAGQIGVRGAHVYAVTQAQRLLTTPLDDGTDDENKSQLTARLADVQAEAELLDELGSSIPTMSNLVREARSVDTDGWETEDITALKKLVEAIELAGSTLVTASKAEEATAALADALQQAAAMNALVTEAKEKGAQTVFLDLEPFSGNWHGITELRQLGAQIDDASMKRPTANIEAKLARPGRLEPPEHLSVGDLVHLTATVTMPGYLAPSTVLHWEFGDDTRSDEVKVVAGEQEVPLQVVHRYGQPDRYDVTLHDADGSIGTTKVVIEPGPGRAESKRARFELTDRRMTLTSGLLAIFSGILALYVPSSTWGSPGDYLEALLWGSVVSEGIKLVTALVARTAAAP